MTDTQYLEDDEREIVLDTRQCAEIALAMYGEWQKAMQPPLYSYKQFPDWLSDLTQSPKKKGSE